MRFRLRVRMLVVITQSYNPPVDIITPILPLYPTNCNVPGMFFRFQVIRLLDGNNRSQFALGETYDGKFSRTTSFLMILVGAGLCRFSSVAIW